MSYRTGSTVRGNQAPADPSRRQFFVHAGVAAGAFIGVSLPYIVPGLKRNISLKSSEPSPVSPPGSLSISHLGTACTACHLCISACPTKVIRPALFDYGISGLFQPMLDYSHGFCEYECNVCSRVCPSGAIKPISLEEKKRTQIGKTELTLDKCIVETKKQQCGACAEVCPTRAVYMVEKDGLFYPETDTAYCIGCGSCHHACPSEPLAILVRGSAIHDRAEEPVEKEPIIIPIEEVEEEFPF